jgi:hypothetical protein
LGDDSYINKTTLPPGNVIQHPAAAQQPAPPNPAMIAYQQQLAQVQTIVQANQQAQAQFDAAVKLIKQDFRRCR